MRIYAREGVSSIWLLDPIARTLETYRLGAGSWVLISTYEGDDTIQPEPFEAAAVTMRRWWLESES